jgi:hypothetical protein
MGEETWIGLAIGVSTLAVALPAAIAHYRRERRRARLLGNLKRHATAHDEAGASVASDASLDA